MSERLLSEELIKQRKKLIQDIDNLNKKNLIFKKQNEFRLKTNTAYILNSNLFEGWEDFKEFIEVKHEQQWQRKNLSEVEVIFKIKGCLK